MTYPPHQGDFQIGHIHNVALREEIGERLAISIGQKPAGMPPRLMMLMSRLRDENSRSIRTQEAFP